MAVGSRAHLESAALAKRSKLRNFLMHGFHALVTFVAGHGVHDTQCGFKVGRGGFWGERGGFPGREGVL
jgi:dolichyl-phosphate beta-glucosyltransferase